MANNSLKSRSLFVGPSRLVRMALLGNAAFSLMSGVLLLVASGHVAGLLGVSFTLPLQLIGGGLVVFAADLVHQATREEISTSRGLLASAGDFAWVAGTAVVILGWGAHLSTTGILMLGAVALFVADFGALQLWGLRKLTRSRTGNEDRATVSA